MGSVLKPLDPYLGGGWALSEGAGYYLHVGYVYLAGTVFNRTPVTTTVLTGIPPELCPSEAVEFSLPARTGDNCADRVPDLTLPTSWPAVMNPDGSLVLTHPISPYMNTIPPADPYSYNGGPTSPLAVPMYGGLPLSAQICLGGVRWRLPGALDTDNYDGLPLAPYMVDGEFDDIDATYFIHGSRIHLGGHVRAQHDGAGRLLTSLPPGSARGLPTSGVFVGSMTADNGGNPVGLWITSGGEDANVETLGDDPAIKPTLGESPPLSDTSPPFGGPPNARPTNYNSPIVYHQAPETPPNVAQYSTGWGQVGGYYLQNDYGSYSDDGSSCDVQDTIYCRQETPLGPGFTVTFGDLLTLATPPPDWIMIYLRVRTTFRLATHGTRCVPTIPLDYTVPQCGDTTDFVPVLTPTLPGASGDAPILLQRDGTPYDPTASPDDVPHTGQFGVETTIYLAPATTQYTGDLRVLYPSATPGHAALLWEAPALDPTQEVRIDLGGTIGGSLPGEDPPYVTWEVGMIPWFNVRQNYIRAGDVLDLSLSGWEGAYDPPAVPVRDGRIAAASGLQGIRRYGRR